MPEIFKSQRQIRSDELPEAHEKLQMLESAIHNLTSSGYEYIGLDHFAKTGDELHDAQLNGHLHRNFQGYAKYHHKTLHAFGVSSISTINNHYCQYQTA